MAEISPLSGKDPLTMGKNPEKIMLFLLPLITLKLFLVAILVIWVIKNWGTLFS
jgi:hypothetical protein